MEILLQEKTHHDIKLNPSQEKTDLQQFLEQWDNAYKKKSHDIDLFKPHLTKQWTPAQKQLFVKTLYHQRAHFGDVLWYMGNFAPDRQAKEMVLNNIRDEFGMNGLSHEKLYLDFAASLGVKLDYELVKEEEYLPFLREYNQGHLLWLRDHDWSHQLSAFAALERLDNVDYINLRELAISLGTNKRDLVFFNVHVHVTHYEDIEQSVFNDLWKAQPDIVTKAFNFIGDYQIEIWKKISDVIFSFKNN